MKPENNIKPTAYYFYRYRQTLKNNNKLISNNNSVLWKLQRNIFFCTRFFIQYMTIYKKYCIFILNFYILESLLLCQYLITLLQNMINDRSLVDSLYYLFLFPRLFWKALCPLRSILVEMTHIIGHGILKIVRES